MCVSLSFKVPVIPVRFSKTTQISNFMKIRPEGTEFVPCGQTDRQTDRLTD